MTYFQFKRYIKEALSDVSGEYAEYEAERIVCRLFGKDRRALSLLYREEAPDKMEEAENMIARRKNGEPLAYILENTDFFGLELYVNSDCLTPRADTEVIVEKALDIIGDTDAEVLDICTGSGCIALAIAANSNARVLGVDVSEGALAVAQRNAEKCGLSEKVRFGKCDALSDELSRIEKKFHLIVSNPPYIPTSDIEGLSAEVKNEPLLALDGGGDGLLFYRRFLEELPSMLCRGGAIVFEFGYDQGDAIASLCRNKGFSCEIFRDYGGNIRGAVIKP